MKGKFKKGLIAGVIGIAFILPINSIVSAAGNTLDAEDGNPASVVFVNNDGNVGVNTLGGTQTPATALHITNGDGTTSGLTIGGDLGFGNFVPFQIVHPNTNLMFERRNPDGALAPDMIFSKTRGSFAFPDAVQFGDRLGIFSFRGHDGVNSLSIGAAFGAEVDGSVELGKVPGKLFFSTSDASGTLQERMTINKDGNVGIGTTAPNEELSVRKDQNSNTFCQIENQTNNSSGSAGQRIKTADASGLLFITPSNYSLLSIATKRVNLLSGAAALGENDTSGINLIAAKSDADIRFYTGGFSSTNERMRISSTGNVGIGTASPRSTLDIEGDQKILFTEIVSGILGASSGIKGGLVPSPTYSTYLSFFTTANTASNADVSVERMRVDYNGNVGIGTTAPTEKLEVAGNILASGAITPGSSRTIKRDIFKVSSQDAMKAVMELEPVRFKYKADNSGEEYLGFIAEDVPEIVAMKDRKHLNPMDLTAVFAKVIQEQQMMLENAIDTITELKDKNDELTDTISSLASKISNIELSMAKTSNIGTKFARLD